MEEFDNPQEESQIRYSIARYEEMLRKKDQYFFDVDAFLNIIDFYIERNEPSRALDVISYATRQHPSSVEILMKHAQLLALTGHYEDALKLLHRAEIIAPSQPDIYMIRGSICSQQEKYTEAIENFNKAIPLAEFKDELYLNIAFVYETWGDYEKAIQN